jgi:hypothetical protein
MLKEAFQWLRHLADEAMEPSELRINDDVVIVHRGTDPPAVYDVNPPRRRHFVRDLDSLKRAVRTWGSVDASDAAIFIGSQSITFVIDDGERRDFVDMRLTRSEEFDFISRLKDCHRMDQADLVRTLKFRLPETNPDLRSLVKSLRMTRNEESKGTIAAGEESLGRQVQSAVLSEDGQAIPDHVEVTVPVFSNPGCGFDVAVTLGFTVLFDTREFNLAPIYGAVRIAQDDAILSIFRELAESLPQTPIFLGQFQDMDEELF